MRPQLQPSYEIPRRRGLSFFFDATTNLFFDAATPLPVPPSGEPLLPRGRELLLLNAATHPLRLADSFLFGKLSSSLSFRSFPREFFCGLSERFSLQPELSFFFSAKAGFFFRSASSFLFSSYAGLFLGLWRAASSTIRLRALLQRGCELPLPSWLALLFLI